MDLRKRILTKNECYKVGEKIDVKGLMLHSTGVNNPKLSRYIDAPELGKISSNHWNTNRPDGRQVCVHGFIGLDQLGDVATYQTLPWNHRGWGGGGKSNDTHIHVEICEGKLDDADYFKRVYKEAVELFAYLCREFDLDPMKHIITHSEGYKKGIASNHADVMHWFPKHDKDMDDFRADVKKELNKGKNDVDTTKPVTKPSTPPASAKPATKNIDTLAKEVIDGKHGSGDARKKSLGANYDAVQKRVNELLNGESKKPAAKPAPKAKSIDTLAQEVIDGKHGSGEARKKSLGSNFDAVQKRVNEMMKKTNAKKKEKSLETLVQEVLAGKHGSGRERMLSLGSRYAEVQKEVNKRLK